MSAEDALLVLYDELPGPVLITFPEEVQKLMRDLAKRRATYGRGRVTNRRLDMRLRENRGRSL